MELVVIDPSSVADPNLLFGFLLLLHSYISLVRHGEKQEKTSFEQLCAGL